MQVGRQRRSSSRTHLGLNLRLYNKGVDRPMILWKRVMNASIRAKSSRFVPTDIAVLCRGDESGDARRCAANTLQVVVMISQQTDGCL